MYYLDEFFSFSFDYRVPSFHETTVAHRKTDKYMMDNSHRTWEQQSSVLKKFESTQSLVQAKPDINSQVFCILEVKPLAYASSQCSYPCIFRFPHSLVIFWSHLFRVRTMVMNCAEKGICGDSRKTHDGNCSTAVGKAPEGGACRPLCLASPPHTVFNKDRDIKWTHGGNNAFVRELQASGVAFLNVEVYSILI